MSLWPLRLVIIRTCPRYTEFRQDSQGVRHSAWDSCSLTIHICRWCLFTCILMNIRKGGGGGGGGGVGGGGRVGWRIGLFCPVSVQGKQILQDLWVYVHVRMLLLLISVLFIFYYYFFSTVCVLFLAGSCTSDEPIIKQCSAMPLPLQ